MYKNIKDKYLASESLFKQILGALIVHWALLFALLFLILFPFVLLYIAPNQIDAVTHNLWYKLMILTLSVVIAIFVCHTLTGIFSLRKNETGITWCQISILIAIGIWIVCFMISFDLKSHPDYMAAFAIVGTLSAWIFQDIIKGVMAFVHMRLNHQLRIGDWIQVPKNKVDGVVTRVSLTNVTIYNWDTTTSSIPTSMLYSDYFINLQKMREGKTYGRRMYKTFILNTGWFHTVSAEEAQDMRQMEEIVRYLPKEEIKEGMINAQLFRLYLFHWLMNNPHISQQPSLIVRWLEQVESGLPLQVYAFITESSLASFEWYQSQIIEHIIKSLDWFGLRLFQTPASYDVNDSNVRIVNDTSNFRKEAKL